MTCLRCQKLLCVIAFVLVGCSLSHRQPSSPQEESHKSVLRYFNNGIPNSGENIPNRVYLKNRRLVASSTESKIVTGHYMEDCRKVAIRQAILDTTMDGLSLNEVSRKHSYQLDIPVETSDQNTREIGALVGVRATKPDGTPMEISYFYIMTNDNLGNCVWKRINSKAPKLFSRRDIESMVRLDIWNKISDLSRTQWRDRYHIQYGTKNDQEIIGKIANNLIEWECEWFTFNKAALLSQAYFKKQYKTQPIMLIDFQRSKLVSNIAASDRGPAHWLKSLKNLKGHWNVKMADQAGTHFISTKIPFNVEEGTDESNQICNGFIGEAEQAN